MKPGAREKHSDAVIFDRETWRAMGRIHARHAAAWITGEGLALVAGACEIDTTTLVAGLDVSACAKAQAGDIADMNLVAKKLPETIKT